MSMRWQQDQLTADNSIPSADYQNSSPPLRSHQQPPQLRLLQPQPHNAAPFQGPPPYLYYPPTQRQPVYNQQPESPVEPVDAKRIRISRACDACRRKKIKCDTKGPGNPCKNCQLSKIDCTFKDGAKKRGPPKGYIEVLENRLKRMERILGGLAEGGGATSSTDSGDEMKDDQHTVSKETGDSAQVESEDHDSDSLRINDSPENNKLDSGASSEETKERPRIPGLTSISAGTTTRYIGDMSPLPFLAQKINFEDARLTSQFGFKIRKFGQSLVVYKDEGQADEHSSQELLQVIGKLKPGETINTMNDWIYAVAGIDKATSDRLLKVYFAYIHPGLPVLNKVLFLKQYRRELGDYPPPTLLNAIYGSAVRYIETCSLFGDKVAPGADNHDWDIKEGWSESLFENLLVFVKGRYSPCISTIQAIVIGQYHRASLDEKIASGWLLNSAATRMAQDLGLHRSSESWDIPESEKETRRRVWWSVYIMDRWSAAATGRPQTIFDEDCDEVYPSESASWEEVVDAPSGSSHSGDSDAEPRFPSLDKVVAQKAKGKKIPIYQPFVQLVKLSEILGRVLQGLYTPRAKRHSAEHGSDAIVTYLDNALAEWRSGLPPALQISSVNVHRLDGRGQTPLLAMSGMIYLSYCTLLILLHRPFIENNHEGQGARSSLSSLSICTNAATRCVDVADKMHYRDFLLVSWSFSIYPVFTASLIHIYNAASSDSIVSDVAKENLVKAIGVLKRLSKLSPGAVRLYEVLKQLMETRKISVEDESLPVDDNPKKPKKKKRRQTVESNPKSSGSPKHPDPSKSHTGVDVRPSTTLSPNCSTVSTTNTVNTETDRLSSGVSTPSSVQNGEWINGLYSSMEPDTMQAPPVTNNATVPMDGDPHTLRQFGLTPQHMFPAMNELQSMNVGVPPEQSQSQQQNMVGSMMMSISSANSLLFGIPDLGFAMSEIQPMHSMPLSAPSHSASTNSYNSSTMYNVLDLQRQQQQPQQTQQPQQQQQPQHQQQQQPQPLDYQTMHFRNHPNNPFWSMPSSIELDDWTAYLLPQQSRPSGAQSTAAYASSSVIGNDNTSGSSGNQSTEPRPSWNPSGGWM